MRDQVSEILVWDKKIMLDLFFVIKQWILLNFRNIFIDTIDNNHYDYASYDQGALQSFYKNWNNFLLLNI